VNASSRVQPRSELRREVEDRLAAAGLANAASEARWIVEAASDPGAAGSSEVRVESMVESMVERRLAGEPLQYVLGTWAFRDLELLVDPRVLIPRPETEVVAQLAIDEAERLGARAPDAAVLAVDLGTGSGALALSLASELPGVTVWATDASPAALAVARDNLRRMPTLTSRVHMVEGDWLDALPATVRGRVQLIVTNPPYVAEPEVGGLPTEVARYEPREALVSGPRGLDAITEILRAAPEWLAPRGVVVCELAPHQAAAGCELAAAAGFDPIRIESDLAGRDRVLVARLA